MSGYLKLSRFSCPVFGVHYNQRGHGVFDKSIRALRLLNALGYGHADTGLQLDLVYNPRGAFLPPPQETLEISYKRELNEIFEIQFNGLNYGLGLTQVSLRHYVGATVLGMLPATFVYSSLGAAGRHLRLSDPATWTRVEVWGPFLLVIALSLLPKILKKRN